MVELVKTTIYSKYFTCTDGGERLSPNEVKFLDLNIHVEDNDIYYGNEGSVTAVAKAGSVITLLGLGNLQDIIVKNKTAGNTAHLSIVGSIVG